MQNPFVEISHVCKTYAGQSAPTLSQVSLQLKQGEIYGIIGTSGAGKSTLMRCLVGLETPEQGDIRIGETYLNTLTKQQMQDFRRQMGMIFQHFNLFSARTALENVEFAMEVHGTPVVKRKARAHELLELVGLAKKAHVYPAHLSGGEKQRVGIARALANSPSILFCDEPTSALDPGTTRSILTLLKTLNQQLNLTIVIITHQMDVLKQICDRAAVLCEGKIVEEGKITDLFIRPKHSMTRELLLQHQENVPHELYQRSIKPDTHLVQLIFEGHSAHEPIVSRIIKRFDIEINILMGSLDSIKDQLFGRLLIELTGSAQVRQAVIEFLDQQQVKYEVVQ